MQASRRAIIFGGVSTLMIASGCAPRAPSRTALQLNWFHDPTFVAAYTLAAKGSGGGLALSVLEGGPTVSPIAALRDGKSQFAIVGADIFLKAVAEDFRRAGASQLVAVFADFQRNPVGWIMHPKPTRTAGLSSGSKSQRELNDWLFAQLSKGSVQIGDKAGTETTAIWQAWAETRRLASYKLTPVGFDSSIVIDAPSLAYPVYLNEEPFKLEKRIGEMPVVFDPAADGVDCYGNVLVTTREVARSTPELVKDMQVGMRDAWSAVREDVSTAVKLVGQYYTGVDQRTIEKQVSKTLEFAFHGVNTPGSMDLSEGGRWATTLDLFSSASALPAPLTFAQLIKQLSAP